MATAAATLCFLAGLVAITVGAWLITPAAGLITGGALLVLGSWYGRKGLDGPTRPTD